MWKRLWTNVNTMMNKNNYCQEKTQPYDDLSIPLIVQIILICQASGSKHC